MDGASGILVRTWRHEELRGVTSRADPREATRIHLKPRETPWNGVDLRETKRSFVWSESMQSHNEGAPWGHLESTWSHVDPLEPRGSALSHE